MIVLFILIIGALHGWLFICKPIRISEYKVSKFRPSWFFNPMPENKKSYFSKLLDQEITFDSSFLARLLIISTAMISIIVVSHYPEFWLIDTPGIFIIVYSTVSYLAGYNIIIQLLKIKNCETDQSVSEES